MDIEIEYLIVQILIEELGEPDLIEPITGLLWHTYKGSMRVDGLSVTYGWVRINVTYVGVAIVGPEYEVFRFVKKPDIPEWADPNFDPMPIIQEVINTIKELRK